MKKIKILLKKDLSKIPRSSGVYFFYQMQNKRGKNAEQTRNNTPIYIGKAINLQTRVKNHFNQPSYRDKLFIHEVEKVGFIETDSEVEALILESQIIKKHQPKYNVMWKDDKSYISVIIAYNNKKIPYVFIDHYHGKSFQISIRQLADKFQIHEIGPFTDSKAIRKTMKFLRKTFPHYTQSNHPDRKCSWCHIDLCPGPNPNVKEYKKSIKRLATVLKGGGRNVLAGLKKEMKTASSEKDFEKAGRLRDQIFSLEKILSHANVISSTGVKDFKERKKNGYLALAKLLNIKSARKIECYDISNIQGKFAVGSMVVFTAGKPDKDQYRKFKIKLVGDKPNDIAMLKEILERRLLRKDWKLPNVMLIDGGKAQLNIAIKAKTTSANSHELADVKQVEALKRIVIISIAKGRRELFMENKEKPIPLKDLPQEVYNLIVSLDNEAHRFAITYHKKVRKKAILGTNHNS